MPTRATVLLVIAAMAQAAFAVLNRDIRPNWEILDPPPTERALALSSFGDTQFLYRILAMELQNAGDEGGRVTPIKAFDMNRVVAWMDLLDTLDARADHHVALALRYFSLNQNIPSIRPLVLFAMRHVDKNPTQKLNWLSAALLMAELRLKDQSLVLEIADQMGRYDDPIINTSAYMIAPLLREKLGDLPGALAGMRRALAMTSHRANEFDLAYMKQFIADLEQRIGGGAAGGPSPP